MESHKRTIPAVHLLQQTALPAAVPEHRIFCQETEETQDVSKLFPVLPETICLLKICLQEIQHPVNKTYGLCMNFSHCRFLRYENLAESFQASRHECQFQAASDHQSIHVFLFQVPLPTIPAHRCAWEFFLFGVLHIYCQFPSFVADLQNGESKSTYSYSSPSNVFSSSSTSSAIFLMLVTSARSLKSLPTARANTGFSIKYS